MFIQPVTHLDVEDIISTLDSSKSIGPYSIPVNLLKILGHHLSLPLAKLINQSFTAGVFPTELKVAKVISLFKRGDPEFASNYKPILLLPVFSKIFEKLMHKRLYSFVTQNHIIYPLQYGFQEKHSVEHALISLTETIRNTLDNRKFGCGIFLDLQKAFDTVNHDILLSKLEHYVIRGIALAWFKSYLSDRYQYVSMNGFTSNLLNVPYGVPQGSVIGPLLFLIFINDLPNTTKKLKFYLFADDTNIYFESQSLGNLCKKVNNELKYVKRWLDANKLMLNVSKSKYIIFHSATSTIPSCLSIKIDKKHIDRAKYVKLLGLLLDEYLSWKYHLSELAK